MSLHSGHIGARRHVIHKLLWGGVLDDEATCAYSVITMTRGSDITSSSRPGVACSSWAGAGRRVGRRRTTGSDHPDGANKRAGRAVCSTVTPVIVKPPCQGTAAGE